MSNFVINDETIILKKYKKHEKETKIQYNIPKIFSLELCSLT